jgi:hypothetical protein
MFVGKTAQVNMRAWRNRQFSPERRRWRMQRGAKSAAVDGWQGDLSPQAGDGYRKRHANAAARNGERFHSVLK